MPTVDFPAPPRITGNLNSDLAAFVEYQWQFYRSAILSGGLLQTSDVESVQKITIGERVTITGGTNVTIASDLPAGINRLVITFAGTSSNGTSPWLILPEFGGVIPSSGFVSLISPVAGSIASASSTAGIKLQDVAVAANSYRGTVELYRHASTAWVAKVSLSSDQTYVGNAQYNTEEDLTGVYLTTEGGVDQFDVVDICYQAEI